MREKFNLFKGFTKQELILWISSLLIIIIAFLAVAISFGVSLVDYLSLTASLIGATALIFVSRASVVGQILTVVFSVFYGIISLSFKYYGEMITYLFMTTPIAIASIITWLKNPSKENKSEVQVNHISHKETVLMLVIATGITVAFYFILAAFGTTNLILSTISVFTSFTASYLTMRRSEYYAIGYAANDIVLIVLWVLATIENLGYLSMIICFVIFLINDTYGFINWRRLKNKQNSN